MKNPLLDISEIMIKVVFGSYVLKSAKKLDRKLQDKLAKNLVTLQKNPFSPSLHTKNLSGKLSGFFSFRINRDWRVIFQFADSDTVMLIDIAHRSDVYK